MLKLVKIQIIQSHVNISGNTKIGKKIKFIHLFQLNDPQDLKYNGEETNNLDNW